MLLLFQLYVEMNMQAKVQQTAAAENVWVWVQKNNWIAGLLPLKPNFSGRCRILLEVEAGND